ncbi:MAG: DUF501 domain-containing protein [Acidimicrobiia bacterium]|nr:DUF501 domain-containing protein [Acidimicrobiia bacterium]
MIDSAVMRAQIGRPLRGDPSVAARCHLGLPTVAAVAPILEDGTPFPTRFWLTCPLAAKRIGRLESIGGVRRMEAKRQSDPAFEAALAAAHHRYGAQRDSLIPPDHEGPIPSGGVAGLKQGIKCLHAHYADTAAGNQNPVGDVVAGWIEPLNCTAPCVVDDSRNPLWEEPA